MFVLPSGTFPWVKMWDHGGRLTIFVSPKKSERLRDKEDDPIKEIKNARDYREIFIASTAIGFVLAVVGLVVAWVLGPVLSSLLTVLVGTVVMGVSIFYVIKTFKVELKERQKLKSMV